jgi:diacylglycerol kinase (ATP)
LPNSRYIEMESGEEFSLKSKKDFLIHYDGEPLQLNTNEIKVSIKKQSLNVIGNV